MKGTLRERWSELWSDARYRLRALVDRGAVERELDAELRFHLDLEAERYEGAGLSREEARRRARAEFGHLDRVKEASRRARGTAPLEALLHDGRVAARRLRRAPGFVATVVVVLALGIGATTAAFGVVNAVLLAPLPFPEPDRLVRLTHALPLGRGATVDQSDATVLLYQRHATTFDGIAAWIADDVDANLEPSVPGETPRRAHVARVTTNLLDVLRVRPALGRGFVPDDGRAGAPRVVLLSDRLWRERYHGDPGVIGRGMLINAVPRTVVGVMPPRFGYPASTVDVWIPATLDPARTRAGQFDYVAIGRLRGGVSLADARADLARALRRLPDAFAGDRAAAIVAGAHVVPRVELLRDATVGPVARVLWIVLASVLLVLVIACANVATLFLVRAEHAQADLAVRAALGSSMRALMTQPLAEAVLLSAAGGGLGVLLASVAVQAAVRAGDAWSLPRLDEVGIEGRTLLFALGATALCALSVSLLPVLRARRVSVAQVLRGAGRGPAAAGSRQRTRDALVVGQTALALVLVASSGLMTRSLMQLEGVRPGFDAGDVAVARVVLPFAKYSAAERARVIEDVVETLRSTPGVRDAAVTDWVPLTDDRSSAAIEVEGRPAPPESVDATYPTVTVGGHYFRTAGIPLLRGRSFEPTDPARPSEDVIVSHAFAQRYWSGASPLGKRIRPVGGAWHTIVGETADVHYRSLDTPVDDVVYFPVMRQDGAAATVPWSVAVLARARPGQAAATIAAIRAAVRSRDPAIPTFGEGTLAETVRRASARVRALVVLLAVASAVALTLGAVGVYGVVAYGVSVRRRELGVRLALGARPAALSRAVALAGLRLAVIGAAIGLPCALAFTRLLRGLLYEVSTADPRVLGVTAIVLVGVAGVASWLPARRAAAIDPAEVLRST